MKKVLPWAVSAVRLLRLMPTLGLLSALWNGFLARLTRDQEPDLVAWLRTYERPLPAALLKKYEQVSVIPTYVSFWCGLEGTVPGSGSGSQPAEAMHAPWQRQLSQLGGAGSVGRVLTVM